jgi:threonine dehydratase
MRGDQDISSTRSIVEPAGALAVAAIKQYVSEKKTRGETYAAILCGANMNFDRLRFVAERAEVGEEREALFAVTIPEERGSFRRFCELIGTLPGGPRNVTEFNYRISDSAKAHVFVGLTTHGKGESGKIAANFSRHGFEALDLTHDELAKGISATWWAAVRPSPSTSACTVCLSGAARRAVDSVAHAAGMEYHAVPLPHQRPITAHPGRLQVPKRRQGIQGFLDTWAIRMSRKRNPVYRLFLQTWRGSVPCRAAVRYHGW